MKLRPKRLLFDIETTGLLDYMIEYRNDPVKSRVHILAIRDLDTRESFVFRQNDDEDTILDGIAMLNEADVLVGHNILNYDLSVLWLIYGDAFTPKGKVRDSLILCRMLFADVKEDDYRRVKRGQLEGRLLGRQGLEAWGQRLGSEKDDYSKRRKTKATEIWATDPDGYAAEYGTLDDFIHYHTWGYWTQEMEDYCWVDVDVNELLWNKIERKPWSEEAVILEHQICDLMDRVKANGFPFDLVRARLLEEDLRTDHDRIAEECISHFGNWWRPTRWNNIDKELKGKAKYTIRPEFGEDDSRTTWGDVTVPKRTMRWKPELRMAKGGDRVEGAAYCPIELKEFNPNSRPQIIDRLKTVYGWEPQEFTEEGNPKGNPKVDDEVLRDLAKTVPICDELAELFYYKKRLGALVDGKNGWIGKASSDGKIHATTNPGGAITNRATHSSPNIAQVQRVVFKKLAVLDEHGQPKLGDDGKPILKNTLMKGRAGLHGWDSRRLFYVPEGWVLMGADQKGIELRALAHFMFPHDQGAYMTLVVDGDPHAFNQEAMGLDSRDTAKTVIYALIYGAQDFKLGITIDPMLVLSHNKAKALGTSTRSKMMTNIPALGAVIKGVQREARKGFVMGLDGRELYVRAKHAALNVKLQGAAATLSKKWCVLFEQYMEEEGYTHGWDGDFAILAWIHDELQVALRNDPVIREAAERLIKQAALDAGVHFEFTAPVDVDVKFGDDPRVDPDAKNTWAATH